jgi:hypothetical protein
MQRNLLGWVAQPMAAAVWCGVVLDCVRRYWCVDGECDDTTAADSAATGRRQLAGSDSCDSPGGGSSRWCRYCVDVDGAEVCDTTPVIGHKYWQVGEDCAKHEAECDCEMMMPASAFSICVRCLACRGVPTWLSV